MNQTVHRKRVRHFNEPGHAHELTFSCYRRLPLLERDWIAAETASSITAATKRHDFQIIAFVFMPEHIHLLLRPRRVQYDIARLLTAIKRPCSHRVKRGLEKTGDPLLTDLTVRERPGKTAFRLWQEGPGYDRNLTSIDSIRSSIDYIHLNPVRRGLCAHPRDWRWTSWRQHHEPGSSELAEMPRVDLRL